MQCVAMCCSVLQRAAVCCSVLQSVGLTDAPNMPETSAQNVGTGSLFGFMGGGGGVGGVRGGGTDQNLPVNKKWLAEPPEYVTVGVL